MVVPLPMNRNGAANCQQLTGVIIRIVVRGECLRRIGRQADDVCASILYAAVTGCGVLLAATMALTNVQLALTLILAASASA
jgi:hypothetical protein